MTHLYDETVKRILAVTLLGITCVYQSTYELQTFEIHMVRSLAVWVLRIR